MCLIILYRQEKLIFPLLKILMIKKGKKNSEEVSKSKASRRCEILREVLEEQKILKVFGKRLLIALYNPQKVCMPRKLV